MVRIINLNLKQPLQNINNGYRMKLTQLYRKGIYVPYIPGCLAFREYDLVEKTVQKLESNIDLYFFDGNGYLHPRHMGLATYAGIMLEKPSIGVTKWTTDYAKSGSFKAKDNRTEEENELLRLRKENKQLLMENDILKQATLIKE